MATFFNIEIKTIDGNILEFPNTMSFKCSEVKPLGIRLVRQFDANECIVVAKVFAFFSDKHIFGTTCISTIGDFINYVNLNCYTNYFLDNGCMLTMNGCLIKH